MSSAYVRTQFKNFIASNAPTEKVVDLSGQFAELTDVLTENSVGVNDTWLGIEFIGDDEVPITVGSNNTQGKYRETGAVYIHVVDIAKLGVSGTILTRAETLRALFRGRKIGTIFVESVTPVSFESGATLQFENGYMSGSFILGYLSDLDL
jgi:hypothetical protein